MIISSKYEVIRHQWHEDANQFWTHIETFDNFNEALRTYDSYELGDDIPEVSLEYHQNMGCYLQKITLLDHKEIEYDEVRA